MYFCETKLYKIVTKKESGTNFNFTEVLRRLVSGSLSVQNLYKLPEISSHIQKSHQLPLHGWDRIVDNSIHLGCY